ncbi:MAG TPA: URC4/urg3 family protein [Stellaceae bacterium]|nr:URC4/urg3 family protein [Stellaceae bacterium]
MQGRGKLIQPDPDHILTAAAVRERCLLVYQAAERHEAPHFRLHLDRLDEAARLVTDITRQRYPDLRVPFHSRWRHFTFGGVDRAALVAPGVDRAETARARIDLAIVSVLLDAGAGAEWRYREAETGQIFARSEGLGVASFRAMQAGLFSADPAQPWRADATALAALSPDALAAAMQHRDGNALAGFDGRVALLRRLGEVARDNPAVFGRPARLGNLYDHWRAQGAAIPASDILRTLLVALGPIWPGRPLGDCGRHRAVSGDGLVAFHKLSQWLAYSLVEPLQDAGVGVTDLDGLTGLAEYRNGGLFLDLGIVEPRDPSLATRLLDPQDEAVVEWRALTVILLDRLAERVRALLGKSATEFPLACVLEGGSWEAGRRIALSRRADGSPPLTIASDGTLF